MPKEHNRRHIAVSRDHFILLPLPPLFRGRSSSSFFCTSSFLVLSFSNRTGPSFSFLSKKEPPPGTGPTIPFSSCFSPLETGQQFLLHQLLLLHRLSPGPLLQIPRTLDTTPSTPTSYTFYRCRILPVELNKHQEPSRRLLHDRRNTYQTLLLSVLAPRTSKLSKACTDHSKETPLNIPGSPSRMTHQPKTEEAMGSPLL